MMNKEKEINEMMNMTEYIRNISIIAHVDHGKTALTESLAHVYMDVGEEKDRGITIKSAAVSLQLSRYEQDNEEKDSCQQIKRQYLINLIDSPGHLDFNSEVSAALRITDGAICVVDCIEGVKVQTNTVLKQSILERVKPVLFLNKIDRIWLEKHLCLEDTYNLFKNTIESVNVICSTYKDDKLGIIEINPIIGNVAFGSGYFGYGFTLNDFAKMYCAKKKYGTISQKQMTKKLWGNNYWNKKTKKWQKNKKGLKKNALNGFCEFILYPLQTIHDAIMENKSEIYLKIISSLNLNINQSDIDKCKKEKDLLKLFMSTWLPAKNAVLDLCADHLPSPIIAQQYRIPNLYTGPLDTPQAQSMKLCDKNGVLSMYISKMIEINDSGRFIAFGRVFSGTVKRGQELLILAPNDKDNNDEKQNDDEQQQKKMTKKKVQGIVMMMGQKSLKVTECSAGNICGLMGIDQHLARSGTLTDSLEIHPFKTMKFAVSAVVKVAVEVVKQKDLKKLVNGLKRLSKYDTLIQISQNKQGQQIIAGAGELHLETCINQLKIYMNDSPIHVNDPIVSFCEGIDGISGSTTTLPNNVKNDWKYPDIMVSKSANKHNRLYATAQPILANNDLCAAIEADELSLKLIKMKKYPEKLFKNWDKNDIMKIWSFGCPPDGKANVIVDKTRGVQYVDKIRSSIIAGFTQVTNGGVLCDEPMRGVRFNIVDAKIHSDPTHRGTSQIPPTAKKVFYAGQLASSPVLLEPIYLVEIDVPVQLANGVYNTLGTVRGNPIKYEDKSSFGISECKISAHVPIIETFKNKKLNKSGFMELLRQNTEGKGSAVMKFSHWQKVNGDPLKNGSMANKYIMDIRKRKGMKLEIPSFHEYYDRL